MERVRVVAAMGITFRGPLKLGLSRDQLARRPFLVADLKEAARKKLARSGGVVTLADGLPVTFKYGEELEVSEIGKLAKGSVEAFAQEPDVAPPAPPAPDAPPATGAPPAPAATVSETQGAAGNPVDPRGGD